MQVLQTAWDMENSQETRQRQNKSRLQLLYDSLDQECVPDCHGWWVTCAKEVLTRNSISVFVFVVCSHFVRKRERRTLQYNVNWSYKLRQNISFESFKCDFFIPSLTMPLAVLQGVHTEKAECIFLNDFRWSSSIIPWHDFWLLLEGQLVHLLAPKAHYAKDLTFKSDTPIFVTEKVPLFIPGAYWTSRSSQMLSRHNS